MITVRRERRFRITENKWLRIIFVPKTEEVKHGENYLPHNYVSFNQRSFIRSAK
jgi:hypothetical protein